MVEWTKGHFEEVARVIRGTLSPKLMSPAMQSVNIDQAVEDLNGPNKGRYRNVLRLGHMQDIEENSKELCNKFASVFEQPNPRFDEQRFLYACEVKI